MKTAILLFLMSFGCTKTVLYVDANPVKKEVVNPVSTAPSAHMVVNNDTIRFAPYDVQITVVHNYFDGTRFMVQMNNGAHNFNYLVDYIGDTINAPKYFCFTDSSWGSTASMSNNLATYKYDGLIYTDSDIKGWINRHEKGTMDVVFSGFVRDVFTRRVLIIKEGKLTNLPVNYLTKK